MYCLKYLQRLPLSLEESWDFFSSPKNLGKITPAYMNFQILHESHIEKAYAGQIISYTICPLWNIPLSWVTEITHVKEPDYFIDEQRLGPYKFWHHEHHFTSISNGVEMKDILYYTLPLGPLGKLLNALKVKKDVEAIFSYRTIQLEKMFGTYVTEHL